MRSAIVVGLMMLVPQLAQAQGARELKQERREMRDDRADVARIEDLIAKFDRARASNKRARLAEIDNDLERLIKDELAEGRKELKKDMAEAHRSERELRETRRDVHPAAARDAKRDLRDDRRDVEAGRAFQQERREVATELRRFHGRVDRRSLDHKRALMVKFLELARAEVAQNRQELREDRRERREDHRDSRKYHREWQR